MKPLSAIAFTFLLIALAMLFVGICGGWQWMSGQSRVLGLFVLVAFSIFWVWLAAGWRWLK